VNILVLTAWYKSATSPTEGSFVEEQARLLQENGHKVAVLHAYLSGNFFETLTGKTVELSEKDDQGIWTMKLGQKVWLPKARQLHYNLLCQKSFRWIQKYQQQSGKIDLIHSHSLFMGGVVAEYISSKLNIPFFHTEHTSGLIYKPQQYNQSDIAILRKVYQKAARVFFVSNFAKDAISKEFGLDNQNFSVLHNLVSPIFFQNISQTQPDGFKAICICNLLPIKKVDFLLHAWKKVIQLLPLATLTIAGEGLEKDRLLDLAKNLNITSHLIWLPRLSKEEVKKELCSHHVLLSTSEVETFGLTIAEALAVGKPVVVADSGGPRDIVSCGDGFIVSHDVEDFTSAILRIWKKEHDYPEIISERCKQKFGSQRIYSNIMNAYSQYKNF
jgi:1,2-diacylglycerol 3-alpha-glucosyltransferase